MNRPVLLKLFLLFSMLAGGFSVFAATLEEFDQAKHDSAVLRIFVQLPSGRGGTGTGFLINKDGYVVTNHHVIEGILTKGGKGRIPDGGLERDKLRKFEIIWADQDKDLAILKVEGLDPSREPLTLTKVDDGAIKKGQKVWTSGYPGASDLTHYLIDPVRKDGVFSAYRHEPTVSGSKKIRLIEHDASTNGGNSGGPVSDACGRVVAVTSFGIKPGKGFGTFFAIRVSELIEELDRLGIDYRFDPSPCLTAGTGAETPLWVWVSFGAGFLLLAGGLGLVWRRSRRASVEGLSGYVRREFSRLVRERGGAKAASGSTRVREQGRGPGSGATEADTGYLVGSGQASGVGRPIPVDRPLLIGRSRDADVMLTSDVISGRHAQVGWDPAASELWLQDLESTNGTFLDGKRLEPRRRTPIAPGAEFYLGDSSFTFRVLPPGG